jgi:hypothetical protein
MVIAEWQNYWRIMQWNRLADSRFEESVEVASRCRTAWRQISAIVPERSQLPKEFLYPLRAFARKDREALELYLDDRRLILCMSDLRDYLELLHIQGRAQSD